MLNLIRNNRNVDELKIIQQCISGKRKAQRELYDKYRSVWFTVCLRYLNQRQDALDALQNSLVKIYSNLKSFDQTKGKFTTWSSRIVVNECLMLIRKRTKVKAPGEELLSFPASMPSAVEQLSAKEIVRLVQGLPDGYRTVFNLYAIEGYKHHEIAEMLGISVGASKSQLHKARKLLQNHISNLFEVAYP